MSKAVHAIRLRFYCNGNITRFSEKCNVAVFHFHSYFNLESICLDILNTNMFYHVSMIIKYTRHCLLKIKCQSCMHCLRIWETMIPMSDIVSLLHQFLFLLEGENH